MRIIRLRNARLGERPRAAYCERPAMNGVARAGHRSGRHARVSVQVRSTRACRSVQRPARATRLNQRQMQTVSHPVHLLAHLPQQVERLFGGYVNQSGQERADAKTTLQEYLQGKRMELPKYSVLRMAFALGHELRPHGATAVCLTPGWLRSEAMLEAFGVTEQNWRDAAARIPHFAIAESPAYTGRAVVALAQDPEVARWNGQSLSSGQLAKAYGFTDIDGSQPDAWRYLVEVQETGKPADTTGYR